MASSASLRDCAVELLVVYRFAAGVVGSGVSSLLVVGGVLSFAGVKVGASRGTSLSFVWRTCPLRGGGVDPCCLVHAILAAFAAAKDCSSCLLPCWNMPPSHGSDLVKGFGGGARDILWERQKFHYI